MAAGGGGPVRLRLVFDFPPPGSPGCALCWLLLEPGRVRLVTDLISLIRHRFGFSRRARLSLFLEGALLPPTESARLVRDNDSLRVKLEEIASAEYEEIGDGFLNTPTEDKKRHRQKKEEDFSLNEKHKHRKKKNKHRSGYPCTEETSVDICDSHKKHKKRKRTDGVSERNRLTEGNEETSGQSKKLKKTGREKELAAKKKDGKQTKAAAAEVDSEQAGQSSSRHYGTNNTKKPTQSKKRRVGVSPPSSTSSDSDSSETSIQQNKSSHKSIVSTLPKDKSQAAARADVKTVVANKVTVKCSDDNSTKTAISKNANKSTSSSSDSDSSAEDERVAAAHNTMAKEKPLPSATRAPKAQTSESESSGSETLVKKSAADAGPSNSIARTCSKPLPNSSQGPLASTGHGRGYGTGEDNFRRGPRGRGYHWMMRGQGPGKGANPSFFYNYNSEGQKQRQVNEAVTNSSVLVQNPIEVPKRDYTVLPLLAAPPQVGERIAFKRLELTENYCPEVSDYKEGKIISWNADKKQIELEILSPSAGQHAKEPGKFDLVYQSADGAELIEYAIPQDTKVCGCPVLKPVPSFAQLIHALLYDSVHLSEVPFVGIYLLKINVKRKNCSFLARMCMTTR
ncbi:coilin isoform X1 [Melopsittacus undulatus]|uniref:coilin isoform X1 n=1 Tax=Melopsittacus undulatus TaxID=13146 RepID=UPI00146DA22B|nr:coilin isoform X1 [Melopsittacus undulatus]